MSANSAVPPHCREEVSDMLDKCERTTDHHIGGDWWYVWYVLEALIQILSSLSRSHGHAMAGLQRSDRINQSEQGRLSWERISSRGYRTMTKLSNTPSASSLSGTSVFSLGGSAG